MRITRLKLVNFIGIKHGMGKDEVEINFPKTDNKIVMLLGDNGSGKSTILSALTPFKDSPYDDRDKLIGVDDVANLAILGTPSMFEIEEHKTKQYYAGKTEILNALSNLYDV